MLDKDFILTDVRFFIKRSVFGFPRETEASQQNLVRDRPGARGKQTEPRTLRVKQTLQMKD